MVPPIKWLPLLRACRVCKGLVGGATQSFFNSVSKRTPIRCLGVGTVASDSSNYTWGSGSQVWSLAIGFLMAVGEKSDEKNLQYFRGARVEI
ncbi:hypothetical protein TNCV_2032611 [Trichonephila clavipes]|nr:hypothetical protein TNCV_2032611 [Trichonephila clavipes]